MQQNWNDNINGKQICCNLYTHIQLFLSLIVRSIWQPNSQLFAGEARDVKKTLARNGVFAFKKDVWLHDYNSL